VNADRHHQAMELFQAALEQPQDERSAFLQQRCGDDQPLRAEVESLLAHHDPRTISIEPDVSRLFQRVRPVPPTPHPTALSLRLGDRLRRANSSWLWFAAGALGLAVILSVLSWGTYRGIRQRLHDNLAGQLQATLESNVAAVDNWLKLQLREMEAWTEHPHLQNHYSKLVEWAEITTEQSVDREPSPHYGHMADLLSHTSERPEVLAVSGVDPRGRILFSSARPQMLLRTLSPQGRTLLEPVWLGGSVLLPPITQDSFFDNDDISSAGAPLIVVGSAIHGQTGDVLGGLFMSVRASADFTSLLDLGRAGPRCDTYAFNRAGQLLSESRYEAQLRECGLLDDSPTHSSVLHVELRDPGVNLTIGQAGATPLESRPLTKMAAAAVADIDGMDLDGYRDYRGVMVVGAWMWLEEYGFGVATEIERDQAYTALDFLGRLAGGVVSLLTLLSLVAFTSALTAARLRREISEAQQLGQYTLEELIGEGGMGRVFLARHAMLRRPTAVKTLDGQFSDAAAVKRFEREVQLVSSLTHPNTIEIFDYGRTTDGVFYFVMEYVAGVTLEQLVERDGPIPVSRTLWILQQVLGSLAEAHDRGLIHRDVKPSNIMLCRRGGVADWVKVVDFGLAKDLEDELGGSISQTGTVSGTPQYIAPECLKESSSPSPAADIYAVGATAFKLLTGREMFLGYTMVDILTQVMQDEPPRASEHAKDPIPAEVDEWIAHCVRRRPEGRPRDAGEALELLRPLAARYPWPREEAESWWQIYESETELSRPASSK
jgi:hypothetical protein